MSLLNTNHLDQSIDKLEIGDNSTFEKQDATLNSYSLSKPHPGFGKDENIKNELGHTEYPKWIDSKRTGTRIVVANKMEEAQHTQENPPSVPQTPQKPPETPAVAAAVDPVSPVAQENKNPWG